VDELRERARAAIKQAFAERPLLSAPQIIEHEPETEHGTTHHSTALHRTTRHYTEHHATAPHATALHATTQQPEENVASQQREE